MSNGKWMTKLVLNPYWDAHPIDEMKKNQKLKIKNNLQWGS
jgi:hypothetical protein